MLERVLSLITFEEEAQQRLAYWLSRPPEERISEVERLRQEYVNMIAGLQDEYLQGLRRSLLIVDRKTG